MATSALSRARKRVRNVLGSDLEPKATDRFCLAFAGRNGERRRLDSVVEFVPQPGPLPTPGTVIARMRDTAAVRNSAALGGSALSELGNERFAVEAGALLYPSELLREAWIREMRERCHLLAGPARRHAGHRSGG